MVTFKKGIGPKVSVIVEPEDMAVEGNALVSGDAYIDKKTEQTILARRRAGDIWAWCYVIIRAEYCDLVEVETLGCCNYKDEADFITNSPYYGEMVEECKRRLLATIAKILEGVEQS